MQQLVLESAGLTFIPLLLAQRQTTSDSNLSEVIRILAARCSAKEIILSLVETLSRIEDEAQGMDEDDSVEESGSNNPPSDHLESLILVLSCFSLGELFVLLPTTAKILKPSLASRQIGRHRHFFPFPTHL